MWVPDLEFSDFEHLEHPEARLLETPSLRLVVNLIYLENIHIDLISQLCAGLKDSIKADFFLIIEVLRALQLEVNGEKAIGLQVRDDLAARHDCEEQERRFGRAEIGQAATLRFSVQVALLGHCPNIVLTLTCMSVHVRACLTLYGPVCGACELSVQRAVAQHMHGTQQM